MLCICLENCLSSRITSFVLWPGMTHLMPMFSQNLYCGWGTWWHSLNFETLSFNSLLTVYNFLLKTSKGALFLPPSDVYVRSFLYLFYTLIKVYYTKGLRDQALSLAPDWIPLLWRSRIPVSFMAQQQPFNTLSGNVILEILKNKNFSKQKLKEFTLDLHARNTENSLSWNKKILINDMKTYEST